MSFNVNDVSGSQVSTWCQEEEEEVEAHTMQNESMEPAIPMDMDKQVEECPKSGNLMKE